MKKLLSLLLVLAMFLSLTACTAKDLEQDLQDLGEILEALEEIDQSYNEGAPETVGDSDYTNQGDVTEVVTDDSYIVEYTSEGADIQDALVSETTDATETVPEETDEDELPIDIYVPAESTTPAVEATPIDENGTYTTKEDVALYIYTYGKLPNNFITKKEAQALGWPGGYLEPYAPGKCIGGDRFGNYEGLLPTNRKYTECDIDTLGAKSRGAKRIVFSNDGELIYYTDDHYESFTLLYGEE